MGIKMIALFVARIFQREWLSLIPKNINEVMTNYTFRSKPKAHKSSINSKR